MSMIMMEGFMKTNPTPIPQAGLKVYYFLYDYTQIKDFKDRYPTATSVGLGWLKFWSWQINDLGHVNVRLSPLSQGANVLRGEVAGPVIAPAHEITVVRPAQVGTFGIVYCIETEDEEKIYRSQGIDLLRRQYQDVHIANPRSRLLRGPPLPPKIIKAYFHYDARNTTDGCKDLWNDRGARSKWFIGLKILRELGAPVYYTDLIYRQVNGKLENIEPMTVKLKEERKPMLPPQQKQRPRPEAKPAANRPPVPPYQPHVARSGFITSISPPATPAPNRSSGEKMLAGMKRMKRKLDHVVEDGALIKRRRISDGIFDYGGRL